MFYTDHPLKLEPFVLVAYASCVGALGMKESTNMNKPHKNKKDKCKISTRVSRYKITFGLRGERGLNLVTSIPDPNCNTEKAQEFNRVFEYDNPMRRGKRFHPFFLLRQVEFSYAESPCMYDIEIMLFSTVTGSVLFNEDMAKNQLANLLRIAGMSRVPKETDKHEVPHVINLHYKIPRFRDEQFCFTAPRVMIQICAAFGVDLMERRQTFNDRETEDLEIVSRLANVTTLREEAVTYKGEEMTEDVFRTKFILDNVGAVLKNVPTQVAVVV